MKRDSRLQTLLEKTLDSNRIFGVTLAVSQPGQKFSWAGTAGNLASDHPYFIASTTKIYVAAVLLQLREEGLIDFDQPISRYLPSEVLEGLHVYRGQDFGGLLTIRHLMSHTSGLPDYFQAKRADGRSLMEHLLTKPLADGASKDLAWTFDDAIQATKTLKPLFRPGVEGKAHYSDSNYQLLGRIIENRLETDLATALRLRIFDFLNLDRTYLYSDPADHRPADIYYQEARLHIPQAMVSFGADGGIVSTAQESLTFIEAFFSGRLFQPAVLMSLQKWNRIFFPLQAGTGITRLKLPWFLTPFGPAQEIVGHSGLSGAFAFFNPQNGIYLAGTVNQISNPDRSFRLMFKAISEIGR